MRSQKLFFILALVLGLSNVAYSAEAAAAVVADTNLKTSTATTATTATTASAASASSSAQVKVVEKIKTTKTKTKSKTEASKIDANLISEYANIFYVESNVPIPETNNVPTENAQFSAIKKFMPNLDPAIQAAIVFACNSKTSCDKDAYDANSKIALDHSTTVFSELIDAHLYRLRNSVHCVLASAIDQQSQLSGNYLFEPYLNANKNLSKIFIDFLKVLYQITYERAALLVSSAKLDIIISGDKLKYSPNQANALRNAVKLFLTNGANAISNIYTEIDTDIFQPFKSSTQCSIDYCPLIPAAILTKYAQADTYIGSVDAVMTDADTDKKSFYNDVIAKEEDILKFNNLTAEVKKAAYTKCNFNDAKLQTTLSKIDSAFILKAKKAVKYTEAPAAGTDAGSTPAATSTVVLPTPLNNGVNSDCVKNLQKNCKGHYLFEKFNDNFNRIAVLSDAINCTDTKDGDLDKCLSYIEEKFYDNGLRPNSSKIFSFFDNATKQAKPTKLRILEATSLVITDPATIAIIDGLKVTYNTELILIDGNTPNVAADITVEEKEMRANAIKEGNASYIASALFLILTLCFIL